jgi:metallo-beta-lactamase class B
MLVRIVKLTLVAVVAVLVLPAGLLPQTNSAATDSPRTNGAQADRAQANSVPISKDWSEPFPPHRMIGNIYYVGSRGLASYLITTPAGHILINANLESSVPLIRESIEKLGFRFGDVKILLVSHAHFDHVGGSAELKKLTGAQYMVMEGDAEVVESGGKSDFQYGDSPSMLYPATKVDRVLHDGDEVKLGDTVLVAHRTAGHTRGCTTWSLKVSEAGKTYDVVIVGSPNVNQGYRLVSNARYPEIARDYQRGFQVLKSLPCDVFLGAHGSYYGMEAKFVRLNAGGANPYIDPEGYKNYVAEREQAFRTELQKQQRQSSGKGKS